MAPTWLKARQTQYTAYAGVYVLVVLAVLATGNFLANRYDKSYDSTANKQFSLSDQTIKIVKGLKRDVQFNYFGPQNEFRMARDTLDRYSGLSPKLRVTYIDPERKPQIARSEEHTSELQSRRDLVCRLLLEKKKMRFMMMWLLQIKYMLTKKM